jgi:hypothetical protein
MGRMAKKLFVLALMLGAMVFMNLGCGSNDDSNKKENPKFRLHSYVARIFYVDSGTLYYFDLYAIDTWRLDTTARSASICEAFIGDTPVELFGADTNTASFVAYDSLDYIRSHTYQCKFVWGYNAGDFSTATCTSPALEMLTVILPDPTTDITISRDDNIHLEWAYTGAPPATVLVEFRDDSDHYLKKQIAGSSTSITVNKQELLAFDSAIDIYVWGCSITSNFNDGAISSDSFFLCGTGFLLSVSYV